MIPNGPAPVRPLPVRKGPRGVRQVEVSPGRWMDEAVAIAQGIPLTFPLPTMGAGPVTRRREAPEVPPMPSPAPAAPVKGPGRPPSPAQEQAYRAVTERGLYWADVAREMGTTAWSVKNMIAAYMRRNGIPGEPPGRTPTEEMTRRTVLAKAQKRKGAAPSEAPVAQAVPAPAHVKAERLVLAPEGHPWAPDPAPLDMHRPIAPPPPDERSDWSRVAERHAQQAVSVVKGAADHAESIPVAEAIHAAGGEPEPVALPAKGTPAPHHPAPQLLEDLTSSDHAPRRGGGGRGDRDDFLARIEREMDALAREDTALVEEARRIVEARTDVATRIERLRTAGEVYRAVMAGRAA